jgi:hypothetical protein
MTQVLDYFSVLAYDCLRDQSQSQRSKNFRHDCPQLHLIPIFYEAAQNDFLDYPTATQSLTFTCIQDRQSHNLILFVEVTPNDSTVG